MANILELSILSLMPQKSQKLLILIVKILKINIMMVLQYNRVILVTPNKSLKILKPVKT